MPRYWTVEEAQAAVPAVSSLLRELQLAADELARAAEPAGPTGASGAARSSSAPSVNGQNRGGADAAPEQRARAIIQQLDELGVQVKDIQTGLIDFPYQRYGREVLLCFRPGEPEIMFWHELETGFAGRRPLSEL